MSRLRLLIVAATLMLCGGAPAMADNPPPPPPPSDEGAPSGPPPSPIEGTWRTQNGTEVTIQPCRRGYCGTLTWVIVPKVYAAQCQADHESFGTQLLDINNTDKSLQSRPIVGMRMLTLSPTGDPKAFNATVYNAEDGKTYDGMAWVVNGNSTLRFGGGCIGTVCVVTQDWPRVPTRPGPPDFSCS